MPIVFRSLLERETNQALGAFVVAFSGLVVALEEVTVQMVGFDLDLDNNSYLRLRAGMGERTALPALKSFLSLVHMRWKAHLTADDEKILKALDTEIQGIIEVRNRLMHGAWVTNDFDPSPDNAGIVNLQRLREHGKGAGYVTESYSPDRLAKLTADVARLTSPVMRCAWHPADDLGPILAETFCVDKDGKVAPRPLDSR